MHEREQILKKKKKILFDLAMNNPRQQQGRLSEAEKDERKDKQRKVQGRQRKTKGKKKKEKERQRKM